MQIDIAAISLDIQNFRHGKVATEREALKLLLEDEKTHKVFELAQDILLQGGLDPSSLLIVTEDPDRIGQYIALEGNRRITALKTLMTPELALETSNYSNFKRLHRQFLELGINSAECVILDRENAATWIKRKHYRNMGGAGVVSWNAVATARSDAAEGTYRRWMVVLAYLESNGVDIEDIRERIASKTTTVERVLTSTHVSSVLGLSFDRKGNVTPENGDVEATVRLLQELLVTMAERQFVETKVSSAKQQLDFINKFFHLGVKKRNASLETQSRSADSQTQSSAGSAAGEVGRGDTEEQARARSESGNSVGAGYDGSAVPNVPDGQSAVAEIGTTPLSTPQMSLPSNVELAGRVKVSKLRKNLASRGLVISNTSLNKFYAELRRLDVEKNPYLSSAIIRIFLEKATTLYLEVMEVPPLDGRAGASWQDFEIKLRLKVDAVLRHMDPQMSNPPLMYARDIAAGNRGKTHTADHLNQAIHSHHDLPAHSEIITIWDRYHPYFTRIFQAIEEKLQS